jgi:arabinogalactan endo-1,4-beta-galactosidase
MKSKMIFLLMIIVKLTLESQEKLFLKGADLSYLPELEQRGAVYTENGISKDALQIFKDHGYNCVRLRLWHTRSDMSSNLSSVITMAKRIKAKGFRFLLDIHYSDVWADPGTQTKPIAWKDLSFPTLIDSVYRYTYDVIRALKNENVLPDIVQIGNEISNGFLWDDGCIDGTPAQWTKFSQLLSAGIRGVKENLAIYDSVRIMIHIDYGGVSNAKWFFDNLAAANISFDIIGLSYYPWWQGNLQRDSLLLDQLARSYPQDIIIAETAYPWTLGGKDNVVNTVTQQYQLLPGYPALPEGQFNFMQDLYVQVKKTPGGKGIGIFYWEPDWVAAPSMGSPWENVALFDFSGNALPGMDVYMRTVYLPLSANPETVNFGTQEKGETSDTTRFIVRNIFYAPATIKSIALKPSGPFELVNLPSLPATLRPADSLFFNVVFHRSNVGFFRDTVQVRLSDTIFNDVQISLSGKNISGISPAKAGIVYVTSKGSPEGCLYTLNVEIRAIDTIGFLGISEIEGMAIRNSDKAIYGTIATPTTTSLYRLSTASGDAALAKIIPVGNISCIAFSSEDTLYAATTTGDLYRINTLNGEAKFIGMTPGLNYTGLSFSPLSGKLWAATRVPYDSIYTLNTRDGTATMVGGTGLFAWNISIAFSPAGTLYTLVDDGYGINYLGTLDTLTGRTTLLSDNSMSVKNLRAIAMISILTPVNKNNAGTIPEAYTVFQNYPNPFNPLTTIDFSVPPAAGRDLAGGGRLPIAGHVRLSIFDILGREVAVLMNEKKDAGRYSVQWDASARSSGIYFYTLEAGEYRETKRMALIK